MLTTSPLQRLRVSTLTRHQTPPPPDPQLSSFGGQTGQAPGCPAGALAAARAAPSPQQRRTIK